MTASTMTTHDLHTVKRLAQIYEARAIGRDKHPSTQDLAEQDRRWDKALRAVAAAALKINRRHMSA